MPKFVICGVIAALLAVACGSGKRPPTPVVSPGRVLTASEVTHAFRRAGVRLIHFGKLGSADQFVGYSPPTRLAVVVDVFPSRQLAEFASEPAGLNGRSVPAIGTANVRVWIARHAAPAVAVHRPLQTFYLDTRRALHRDRGRG